MEVINHTPLQFGTLTSKWPQGNVFLTIIVKGTFDMTPGKPAAISSKQIPLFYGDEFYDEKKGGGLRFEADTAPFKPRADIVLVGRAYVPEGRPLKVLDTALRIGPVSKTIRVFGDRRWKYGGRLLPESMTEPEFFTVMDLVYERAFGGMDMKSGQRCEENPAGCGFFTKKSRETFDKAPLPNLEDPAHLIRKWDDHPRPVGFGFYGKAWMPRVSYLGTYDEKWEKERCPDLPADFCFDFYNAAHPDLQVEGYLKGDEAVELIHLSPEGILRFMLPRIRPSAVVMQPSSGDPDAPPVVKEVAMNLDTLCLLPEQKQLYAVWRGRHPVSDMTAMEIKKLRLSMRVIPQRERTDASRA